MSNFRSYNLKKEKHFQTSSIPKSQFKSTDLKITLEEECKPDWEQSNKGSSKIETLQIE